MTTHACSCYDFRMNADSIKPSEVRNMLKGIAKKYVFQREVSESGYNHYQGRLSLIKKRRKHAALKLFVNPPNYFEPTTYDEYKSGDAFYAMKLDTRAEGPFSDQDEERYIPRQVREMDGLRPFQQHIVDDVDTWDKRTINVVYCRKGNKGKSCLVSYMRAYKLGRPLPPVNDYRDLMRMVCDLPTSRMYLFDMPRALNKERMFSFYSAVETIKDGYAFDDRYSFKDKDFDCPNIWIFCNTLPDLEVLGSMDRWKVWDIDDSFNLVEFKSLDNI